MNALHLLWIVPVCTLYGFLVNCLFASNKEKKNTNGSRIRAMSDEELAVYLAEPCECSVDPTTDGYRECGNDLCKKHLLEWLKQPVEE